MSSKLKESKGDSQMKRMIRVISVAGVLLLNLGGTSGFAAETKYTDKQISTVKSFFSDIASSQPSSIKSSKKYTLTNSPAFKFADVVEKHFLTSEYFKVRDKFGNVSKLVSDPKGKSKFSKNKISLDSYFDVFDGTYSNFKFNKSGKLIDWKYTTADGKSNNLKDSIYDAVLNYENDGIKVDDGYLWAKPNGTVFIQLEVTNVSLSRLSWSYAGGRYVAADNTFHNIETKPYGCITEKGVVQLESLTTTSPVLARGTDSVVVAPMYKSCNGQNNQQLYLRMTLK